MSFKVNSSLSKPSCVNGGSPQGTKLGNFLFIVTINAVEDGHDFVPPAIEDPEDDGEDIFGLRQLAGRIGVVRWFDSGVAHASTPRKLGTTDRVLRYIDESGQDNSSINFASTSALPLPSHWQEIPSWVDKYVDDVNAGERHYLKNAVSSFSQNKEQKKIHATAC